MAVKSSPRGGNRITTNLMGRPYWYFVAFVTNSTAAPDGVAPSNGHTIARTDAGEYTITFDEAVKPATIHFATAEAIDTSTLDAEYFCTYHDYVASTGVATIAVGTENTTSGVVALADSTDVKIKVLMLCNGAKEVSQ
jgi:hypothetical protein